MKRRISFRTRRAVIEQLNVTNVHDITKFQRSAVIGMWRMGNPENLIAALNNLEWKDVVAIIKTYQSIRQ